MKKNKMMRLASAMMVLTLMSTSVISGTFAKYVTTASGSDTARVAKWGVTITANGETFATSYDKHDAAATVSGATVKNGGSDSMKLVAPGTSGSMVEVDLAGTPEVAVRVNYSAELTLSDNWTGNDGTTFYCPLIINIEGTEIKGSEYNNKADFIKAVKDLVASYSKEYEANKDLSTVSGDALSIYWSWPFVTEISGVNHDIDDTALGNQAALGNPATITLEVTTTVTQID